ncbi:MAG: TonB-dependent receptor [Gammaproteobacteria bacterium]|nr:TonB-dependent receptor [Gammaproteobacteria bacterium]
MKIYRYSPLLLPLITTTSPVVAADEAMASIIVTATRTAQTADETLAPVTIITKDDIEQSQAGNLTELLAGTVGIDVTETGWYGQSSGYFIRGTSSKHILVLVDGVRLGSATTGSTDLAEIGLNHIERIEIVRGPRTSLYGSDAIGGVIHIFTNQGSAKKQANIEIGYGSHNTKKMAAGISGGNDKTQLRLNLSQLTTDGTNVTEGNNPDNDGYEVSRISATVRQQISNTSTLDLSIYQSQGMTEYDGYTATTDYTKETVQQSISTSFTFAPLDSWDIKLQASTSRDESDNFQDGVLSDIFHTQRKQYSWLNNVMLSDSALLTLGVDKIDEEIDSQATTYTETKRAVTGSFADIQKNYGNQDILISLRNDKYDAIGAHTTGNLDWGYALSEELRITAGYGTAFKAPSFNDLYYPNQYGYEGNPDLRPESSKSFEVGLRGRVNTGNWAVNLFRTKIDDLIDWQCISGCTTADWSDDYTQPLNINSVQIEGVETSIEIHKNSRDMRASLTLLNPENLETGNTLQNRSKASLRVDLNKNSGKWRNGATILVQGSRYADSANTRELDAYTTIDLRTRYTLNKSWFIKGKIRNLFNKEYLTTDTSYQPAERTFMISASYKIDRE